MIEDDRNSAPAGVEGQTRAPAMLQVNREARNEGMLYYFLVEEKPRHKAVPIPANANTISQFGAQFDALFGIGSASEDDFDPDNDPGSEFGSASGNDVDPASNPAPQSVQSQLNVRPQPISLPFLGFPGRQNRGVLDGHGQDTPNKLYINFHADIFVQGLVNMSAFRMLTPFSFNFDDWVFSRIEK